MHPVLASGITVMSQKNGAVIHVERGYQIAEVLEDADGSAPRFAGYRLIGPGADFLPVFATEDEAMYALARLVCRQAPPDPAPG